MVQAQVDFASSFLTKFQASRIQKPSNKLMTCQKISWSPFHFSQFKLNSNAVVRARNGFIGIGLVFRNHLSGILIHPETAKRLALYQGLQLVVNWGIPLMLSNTIHFEWFKANIPFLPLADKALICSNINKLLKWVNVVLTTRFRLMEIKWLIL